MSTARTRTAKPELQAENALLRAELDELKSRLGPPSRSAPPQLVGESWQPEFAELLPDAVFVLCHGLIVAINSAGVRQFGGTTADDVIGRSNLEFLHPDHLDDARDHMRGMLAGEERHVYLQRHRLRLDGTEYPGEVAAMPCRWQGEPAMLVLVRDLSDRAEVERKLTHARAQLAEAVNHVSDGLALFDGDERFVFANEHYLENDPVRRQFLTPGVTFEEFITRTMETHPFRSAHSTVADEVAKRLAWFRSGGAANEFRDQNGRWHLISHRRTPSGGTVIMSTDITARKEIERQVLDRAEQLRLVLNNAPFGIYVRKDREITLVNRALLRMLGAKSEADLIGQDTVELVHPDDRAGVLQRMNEKLTVGETGEPFLQRYMRLDGGYVWTEATPTPIEWEGGLGALVFMRDATQRVELRRAYDMQQAVLREALESINEGIWVFDADQELVIANDHVREMLDLPPEMLAPGTKFSDIMRFCVARGDDGGGDPEERLAQRLETSRTRVPRTFERSGPGGRTFEVRYAPMPGGGLVATRTDITERREFETARDRLTEQLLAQAKDLRRSNEELEQFAYVASHDLQEPLRSISGYCQLLQRRYGGKLDQSADEFIQFAVDGAQRMQLLINDLLRYSRVGTRGKPFERTDCNKAVADAIANLNQAIAESGAEVTSGDLPPVMGDPVQLGQLFQNLIGNAIKFRGDAAPVVSVDAAWIDGETVYSISDNGIGIEPRHQERIFQIFQRLHERGKYPGTGIGLAVCKKIVGRHGGRIWVESAPGQGASFHFTLARKLAGPMEEIAI